MRFYIIRNKLTKKYIPYPSRGRKAKTHVELTDTAPPRLFSKKSQATQALKWWLDGKFYYKYDSGNYLSPPETYLNREKIFNRVGEEMEVVEVEISIKIDYLKLLEKVKATLREPNLSREETKNLDYASKYGVVLNEILDNQKQAK